MGHACSGSKSEDIGGVSLPVVHPVLGFKPKITLIGSLDTAVPEQLSDDALATLRESLSNVVPNAEADAGDVLVGVDTTAKTLTIQVEDNGVGIDPQVTLGRRNTAARARAFWRAHHGRAALRAGDPPSPGWHSRLRESGSRSPSRRGETLQSAPTFSGAATGVQTVVRTRWTVGP